ncbi:DUF397 domain-containing protein [Embleya sp. AB8]|uniref:DUF397 domain-containing protein n=1 Tax=Embleya sp. AB8 TaxID=3156304 RepID=UPI003C707831
MTALQWRTSTYSGAQNECVEVAPLLVDGGTAVRDSKDRRTGIIRTDGPAWSALVAGLKRV